MKPDLQVVCCAYWMSWIRFAEALKPKRKVFFLSVIFLFPNLFEYFSLYIKKEILILSNFMVQFPKPDNNYLT